MRRLIETLTADDRSSARRPPAGRTGSEGFTLLEILVVVAILGLLIGLVAPAALRQLSGARNSIAKQSIERISSVLDLYKLDVGSYPSTDQGLAVLVQKPAGADNWNGPYLKGDAVPMDPWNRPYVFRNPSERSGHDFDLCSLGPTGNASQGAVICNP
jgi:general secretion pathway protein G